MKPQNYQDRKKVVPKPDGSSRYVMGSLKSHKRPLPYVPSAVRKPDSPDRRGKTV